MGLSERSVAKQSRVRDVQETGRSIMLRSRRTSRWLLAAGLAALWLAASARAQPTPSPTPGGAQGKAPAAFHRPSEAELRARLTPLQYRVTQEEGTEPAFRNQYWDEHRPGIYVDVVSGEPLFSSLDKFDSGTGWPSFTRPLDEASIRRRNDYTLFLQPRTEVRSVLADSHLGHVFDDGPPPTGQRYCMNSAALRFVPVDRLETEGYGRYLPLFAAAKPQPSGSPPAGAHVP